MKKLFFIILLGSFLTLSTQQADAHFLKTDKTIGIILHVDPDDDPTPGQPANLYFDFGDKTHRFTLEKCNCVVTVTEQGKQIFSQPFIPKKTNKPSTWGTSIPFTFPNRDVYTITIQGAPVESNAFQTFTISWNFRVDQQAVLGASTEYKEDPSFPTYLLLFSLPIIFLIAGVGWLVVKGGLRES